MFYIRLLSTWSCCVNSVCVFSSLLYINLNLWINVPSAGGPSQVLFSFVQLQAHRGLQAGHSGFTSPVSFHEYLTDPDRWSLPEETHPTDTTEQLAGCDRNMAEP